MVPRSPLPSPVAFLCWSFKVTDPTLTTFPRDTSTWPRKSSSSRVGDTLSTSYTANLSCWSSSKRYSIWMALLNSGLRQFSILSVRECWMERESESVWVCVFNFNVISAHTVPRSPFGKAKTFFHSQHTNTTSLERHIQGGRMQYLDGEAQNKHGPSVLFSANKNF